MMNHMVSMPRIYLVIGLALAVLSITALSSTAGTLTGIISDSSGNPIAGAIIQKATGTSTTDALGNYTLTTTGAYDLFLRKDYPETGVAATTVAFPGANAGDTIVPVADATLFAPNMAVWFFAAPSGLTQVAAGEVLSVDTGSNSITLKAPLAAAVLFGDFIRTPAPAGSGFARKWITGWGNTTNTMDITLNKTGRVEGYVRDARTGSPISGASVSIGAAVTTSGMDGHYQFDDVDASNGPVSVSVSVVGYQSATIQRVYPTDMNNVPVPDPVITPAVALANYSLANFNLIATADIDRVYTAIDGGYGVTGIDNMIGKTTTEDPPVMVTRNYGGWTIMQLGIASNGANIRRDLLRWDLSGLSIPANAWIRNAQVVLRNPVTYPNASGKFGGVARNIMKSYAIPATATPWEEGPGGLAGLPGAEYNGSSWNNYTVKRGESPEEKPWATAGVWTESDLYGGMGYLCGGMTSGEYVTIDVTTLARNWIANPSTNTGVLLKNVDETSGLQYVSVASRTHFDGPSYRPALKIRAIVPPAGQGVIHGRVTDSRSGDPLANAVIDFGNGQTAVTEYDGVYWKVLNAGTVSATASYPMYGSQTSSATVPNGGDVSLDFSLTGASGRTTYVFLEGLNDVTDVLADSSIVYASGTATDKNYGSYNSLKVGNTSASAQTRSLIKYNLSRIPAGANVLSAQLFLTTNGAPPTSALTINAHKVTQNWVESYYSTYAGTGVYNNGATWIQADGNQTANRWTTPGGTFDSGTVVASTVVGTTDTSGTQKVLDLTALTQGWVAGTEVNNGIILKPNDTSTLVTVSFRSKESSVPDESLDYIAGRPKLVVVTGTPSSTFSSPADFAKAGRWNLVSVPADPVNADPLVVFSGINVADASFQYWKNNTEGGGYQSYGAMFGWTGPIERGTPYWFLEATATVDKQISFEGMAGSTDFTLTIPSRTAAPFWIMFGTPFNSAILADNIRFKNVTKRGDTWLTWEQAFSEATPADRIVDSNAQGWSAADNRFVSVTPTAFIGEYHQIEPWWGYWLLVYDAGELLIKFPKP